MNNSICTLFDNILIDIHKFKSLRYVDIILNISYMYNFIGKRTILYA